MSEENVQIVRDFVAAAQGGDWERVGELVDPDIETHGTVGGLDEGRVFRGLAEIRHAFETEDAEAWEERRLEPTEYLHAGDLVLVLIHEYRRGRGSGVELENETAVLVTVRDGRIVTMKGYMDQSAAREASGLSD